ncbi:AP-1 complex subunit mu-1-I [Thelohanellus kitauei]|uniref:AP-1 complex subunit mu-1-I n=1 Tax=Thelohanellus kitauei TaxID=669202 RepID=A0A0C2MCM7_THEKT|nr:AP-1 complex subunit mu-1-I [Thelohanellus kitauei]
MSISAIYILDDKGNRLLHRDFRGDIDTKCIEVFEKMLFEVPDMSSSKPVFTHDDINYIFLKSDPLYLVAVSNCNVNVFTILSFLRTLVKIIFECIGKLDPEKIVSEVVMIITLMDEAMDFGYPQFTESRSLKSCLKADTLNIFNRATPSITPTAVRLISWRPDGISYRRNEVFVDVIEKVNLLVIQTNYRQIPMAKSLSMT